MESLNEGAGHTVTNASCFRVWRESPHGNKISSVRAYLSRFFDLYNCSNEDKFIVNEKIRIFSMVVSKKWLSAGKNMDSFLKYNRQWLSEELGLPVSLKRLSEDEAQPGVSGIRGRHPKAFEECASSTKRKKVHDLLETRSTSELSLATSLSLRAGGHTAAAALVKDLSTSPETARNLKSIKEKEEETNKALSVEQSLALYLDLNLSESKYRLLRTTVNSLHKDTFPSIYALRNFKKTCYPAEKFIQVSESHGEVNLQALLDHTVTRIVEMQAEVLSQVSCLQGLTMIYKWGFDGSSGHSLYKQKFSDASLTDEYLFSIALVPLQLKHTLDEQIIWHNPRPSSTRYCRPIKFVFVKESSNVVRSESERFQTLISNLSSSNVSVSNLDVEISHDLHFTMVDGSICNIVSGTDSSAKCFICGAKPSQMNSSLERVPNAENYKFGISTLHAWIRCFECLLHIAYKLPIKSWQARGDENKIIVQNNKQRIQAAFREKLGLIVDKPKPGFGSTNDGNTARRFFRNASISAEITGINEQIIKKFSIILNVISSGYNIELEKFRHLLTETRALYLENYSWYYMPVTVHKLLVHGIDIISTCILPIGQMSEEALEARHKEIRKIREHQTRKSSRENTNRDLLNLLLLTSDPKISSLRNCKIPREKLSAETLNFLKSSNPSIPTTPISSGVLEDINFSETENSSSDCEE